MWNDPIVEEVRQIRRQIEAECEFDIEKIYAKGLEIQNTLKHRAVTQPLVSEVKNFLYEGTSREHLLVKEPQAATSYSTTKTMLKEIILSFKAPEPVGPYPHARRAGNLLFLSGIGPRERGAKKIPGVELDENGEIISHDIEAQCHAVFRNVKYVLEEAGSGWDKIIDVTVFLTDMKNDFATFNRIYAQYFTGNQPSRTTVEVNRLPTPIAIELKVIAAVD